MTDITKNLSAIENGEPTAGDELLPLVYQELRKLAAAKLAREKPGQTIQATVLVHEAWLRLVGADVDIIREAPASLPTTTATSESLATLR